MLPQSHAIMAKLIHQDVKAQFQVELNKKQLIYGSIKPDIYSGFPKLKHFKTHSFREICHEIALLTSAAVEDNTDALSRFSQQLGIVTHYVADYFCVPHNDRKTYHKHFMIHLKYENELHGLFKQYAGEAASSREKQSWLDFSNVTHVMNYIDDLHGQYQDKGESYLNDLYSSMDAIRTVSLMIVRQAVCEPVTAFNAA